MKYKFTFHNNNAVSEVIGGIFLIAIAVLAFAVLRFYLFPDLPPIDENIKLVGYVNENGVAVIEHVGGKSLSDYRVLVRNTNGALISSNNYRNLSPAWGIGDCIYPLEDNGYGHLNNESTKVQISIFSLNDDGSEQMVFDGILSGKTEKYIPFTPMLISSLRTDTSDEDLICYTDTVNPDVNATTYIYNWLINGNPIAEVIMPFDTNSNIMTKDYSGNRLDGYVRDCIWSPDGVVGGCYYFGGSKEFIAIEVNLPPSFDDITHNDFTISIWVKSNFMDENNKIIFEIRKDTKNYVRLFQSDSRFVFGVCTDDMKKSVVTTNVLSDVWYHIVTVWEADSQYLAIYQNGTGSTERGDTSFSCGSHTGLSLGHGNSGSGGYWYGLLDELEVYNYVLSSDQITQIFISQKDGDTSERVFVSEETSIGQTWQVVVTPNDSIRDGVSVASNTLTIINYSGG
jgi:hypothetical protein